MPRLLLANLYIYFLIELTKKLKNVGVAVLFDWIDTQTHSIADVLFYYCESDKSRADKNK